MKQPSKVQKQRPSRRFVLRPYRRIPTWYLSYYMSGDQVGKGMVTNLSCTGMRVLGDHGLRPGTELTVRIDVQENYPPIEIERATVQWVNEAECGLHFDSIGKNAAKQVTQLITAEACLRRSD